MANNNGNASVVLLSVAFLGIITAKSYEHLSISENLQKEAITMKIRQVGKQTSRNSLILAAALLRDKNGTLPGDDPDASGSGIYPDPYYPIENARINKNKGFFPKSSNNDVFKWSMKGSGNQLEISGKTHYRSQKKPSEYKSTVSSWGFSASSETLHLINKVHLKSKSFLSKAGSREFRSKAKVFVAPPPPPKCWITCDNCDQPGIQAPAAECVQSPPKKRTVTNADGTTSTVIDPAVMTECSGVAAPSIPDRPEINSWNADVLRDESIILNIHTKGVVADAEIRFQQPNGGNASDIALDAIEPDTRTEYMKTAPYPDANRIGIEGTILSGHSFTATRTGVYTVWLAGPGNLNEMEKDNDGQFTGKTLDCLNPNNRGSRNAGECSPEYQKSMSSSSCTFALHVVSNTTGCNGSTNPTLFGTGGVCTFNDTSDSFYGSTKVVMADGNEKDIRNIRVGDKVWNPVLDDDLKVEEVISKDVVSDLLEFTFGNSKIIVTNSHPLLTARGYVSAVAVKRDDKLLTWDGKSSIIRSKRYVKRRGQKVFDLILDRSVPKSSRFFVAEGIIAPDFDYQIEIQTKLRQSSWVKRKHISLNELFTPRSPFDRANFELGSSDGQLTLHSLESFY